MSSTKNPKETALQADIVVVGAGTFCVHARHKTIPIVDFKFIIHINMQKRDSFDIMSDPALEVIWE